MMFVSIVSMCQMNNRAETAKCILAAALVQNPNLPNHLTHSHDDRLQIEISSTSFIASFGNSATVIQNVLSTCLGERNGGIFR
jgi:hypothetical protein